MKKLLVLMTLLLGSLSVFASAPERCDYINEKLGGTYSVKLIKRDGDVEKVGKVKFAKTKYPNTFTIQNSEIIGDILLPGAPKMIKLMTFINECLFMSVGKMEMNTVGSIVEGEDMKAFSVLVDDEVFESISFSK